MLWLIRLVVLAAPKRRLAYTCIVATGSGKEVSRTKTEWEGGIKRDEKDHTSIN